MYQTRRYTRKLTQNGQVTVPQEVRDMLGLKTNDDVVFEVHNNHVTLKAPDMNLDDVFSVADATVSRHKYSDQQMIDIAKEERITSQIRKKK